MNSVFFLYQTALHIFTQNWITLKSSLKRHTKTSNNTKTRPYSHLAKQRYKDPDNIEKVYIQLRCPDCLQLNKIERERE